MLNLQINHKNEKNYYIISQKITQKLGQKMNDFSKLLREKNLKITAQRVAILDEIYKRGHLSIDDIFSAIRGRIPSVSLATIYKNILSMQSANIIKSVKTPTQKQKYELNKKPHIHLHCKICDNLEDFDMSMDEFRESCEKKSGYKNIDEASIIFSGICQKCQK